LATAWFRLSAGLKIKFAPSSSSSCSSSAFSGQFEDDDENEQDSVSTPFSDALSWRMQKDETQAKQT
jgi:hypothetical protein